MKNNDTNCSTNSRCWQHPQRERLENEYIICRRLRGWKLWPYENIQHVYKEKVKKKLKKADKVKYKILQPWNCWEELHFFLLQFIFMKTANTRGNKLYTGKFLRYTTSCYFNSDCYISHVDFLIDTLYFYLLDART